MRFLILGVFLLVLTGCSLNSMTKYDDWLDEGGDFNSLRASSLFSSKVEYCSNLMSSEKITIDYMRRKGALNRYNSARKYDPDTANKMFSSYQSSAQNEIRERYLLDNSDLYISEWTLALDKYDEDLGGHIVVSDFGKRLVISKSLSDVDYWGATPLASGFFADDYEVISNPLWSSIYGVNLKDVNGWDSNGRRVYKPKTAYIQGNMNVFIDVPIDTEQSVGLAFNENLNQFVLRTSKEQSRQLVKQAISRGTSPQIKLVMSLDITHCVESDKQHILRGEVVEAKTFFLEYSQWENNGNGGWAAGDMISNWLPSD